MTENGVVAIALLNLELYLKCSYPEEVQAKAKSKRLGSREFWKTSNQILNRGKASVPTIIDGPRIILSSSDKAKLFANIFGFNSRLDDKGNALTNLSPITEQKLSYLYHGLGSFEIYQRFDSKMDSGSDKIPEVVLKNISRELSPKLAKLFNRCLKEKSFPSLWKVYALLSRMQESVYLDPNINQSASLASSANALMLSSKRLLIIDNLNNKQYDLLGLLLISCHNVQNQ